MGNIVCRVRDGEEPVEELSDVRFSAWLMLTYGGLVGFRGEAGSARLAGLDEIIGPGGIMVVVGRTEGEWLVGDESESTIIEEAGGTAVVEGVVKDRTFTVAIDAAVFCGGFCGDGNWLG